MTASNSLINTTNTITKWGAVALLVMCVIYLVVLSILVQDLKYPREHPLLFTLETLLFSLGTGSIIFLMAYGRGALTAMTTVEFLVVSVKFGVLHILLQFSGFYTYVFGHK
jgi:uncharacterized SAM-binding protein YcdF (DUF218 family)